MPIFDTTQPNTANTWGNYIPTPPQSSSDFLQKLIGQKADGTQNLWGDALQFTPLMPLKEAGNIYEAYKNSNTNNAQNYRNTATGAFSSYANQAQSILSNLTNGAIPQQTAGLSQLSQVFMKDGGVLKGGSHASGNDMQIVHSLTGKPTGVKIEGGEMVVSEDRTEGLKKYLAKKSLSKSDYKGMERLIREQMAEKPERADNENGEVELADGGIIPFDSSLGSDFSNYYIPQDATTASVGNAGQNAGIFGYPFNNQAPNPQDANWQGFPYANGTNNTDWSKYQPATTPDTTAAKSTSPNYWNYVPGAAQSLIGLAATTRHLPTPTIPAEWTQNLNNLRLQSTQGFSPAEMAMYKRDAMNTYRLNNANLANNAQGNAGAILGNQSTASNDLNDANLKLMAMNKGQQRLNQQNYQSALGTDVGLQQHIFDMLYNQALQTKNAGAALANTGLTNLQSANTYTNLYNSPEYKAYLAQLTQRALNQ
jgi:hypothetical protein